jgi:hypothetical protein
MELFTWPRKKEVLISNLRWQVLDPFADKLFIHDQIHQMLAEGHRYFLKYKNGADVNMGFTSSTAHEALAKFRVYSVAAKVATHPRFKSTTALALMQLPETEEPTTYAIGLVDGNVVMDEQLASADIDIYYRKFAVLCESSGRHFVTHGDIAPEGLTLNHPFTLAELVEGGKGKKVKLEKLQDDKKILLVIFTAIAALTLMLLLWGWDWYQLNQKKLEDQFKRALETPAYLYEVSVKNALTQDYLLAPTAVAQIGDQLREVPAQLDGWVLNRMSCALTNCQLTWKSTGGTYEDFGRAAPKSWGKLSLGTNDSQLLGDLKTIEHTLKLSLTTGKLPPPPSWPSREDFLFQMGVNLQKLKDLKWPLQLQSAVQQAVPPPIQPAQVAGHPNAIYAMPWSLAETDWSLSRDIFATLGSHITLEKFTFLIKDDLNSVTFSASGKAYVR